MIYSRNNPIINNTILYPFVAAKLVERVDLMLCFYHSKKKKKKRKKVIVRPVWLSG